MLTWETVLDTSPTSTTTSSYLAEEPNSNLWEYYIDNDRALDRSALITMGDYTDPKWSKTANHLTSQEVKRIGIKHFPQIGAIGFFTFLHEERSKIIAPIHTQLKKYTAPSFEIEETDNTFIFHCTPPEDTTYICYRIILRLGDFAVEYITYENTLEVTKPVTTGTYDIYCIGYIHEGEAVSEDSLHYYIDVEGTRSDWPGPMEGSDIFVTDIEITKDNKIHFTRSDGYKKDSDNVIPSIKSAHFLEDGRLSLFLNTGETIETDNSAPVGSSTLAALTDVELNNPQNGESLVYKDEQWINQLVQSGGGGGGNSGVSVTTDLLYYSELGESTTGSYDLDFTDAVCSTIYDYDFVLVCGWAWSSGNQREQLISSLIPKDLIKISSINSSNLDIIINGSIGSARRVCFSFQTEGKIDINRIETARLTHVYGIKFGGGSSSHKYSTIDYDNMLEQVTTRNYTASEDCYVEIETYANDNREEHYFINGIFVGRESINGEVIYLKNFFLRKGDTVSFRDGVAHTTTIRVFSLKATESSYHNYSTDEHVVGTWIDGKPIYEKTLILNNQYLSSGFTDILHGIDNIDMYVDLKGNYKNLSNSNSLLLSHMNTNGLHLSIGAWCENKTTIRISAGSSMSGNYNIYLTIQYTKTTN